MRLSNATDNVAGGRAAPGGFAANPANGGFAANPANGGFAANPANGGTAASPPNGGTAALQVLTLGLGAEIFAVETEAVHEVLDLIPITEVPNSRTFVRGLVNVRGKVVPVVDLRAKFGMPTADRTADSRIVVMEVDLAGEPTMVGLLADRVYEVAELAAASLEEAPRLGMRWRTEFIQAIGKRADSFVIVIDIDRVIASEESPLVAPARQP